MISLENLGPMKRIAVLSDIHGNIAALEQVVADFKARQVDRVFNLGDHISGPLWPKETIEFLMRQNWIQVRGNHDRQLVEQDPKLHNPSDRYAYPLLSDMERDWLKSLPAQCEVDQQFHLFHGTPTSDTTYLLETVAHGTTTLASQAEIKRRLGAVRMGVLLCGHTHTPRVVEIDEEKLIVNPGSVGLQAYDDDVPEYHAVGIGSHHARYALLEYRPSG